MCVCVWVSVLRVGVVSTIHGYAVSFSIDWFPTLSKCSFDNNVQKTRLCYTCRENLAAFYSGKIRMLYHLGYFEICIHHIGITHCYDDRRTQLIESYRLDVSGMKIVSIVYLNKFYIRTSWSLAVGLPSALFSEHGNLEIKKKNCNNFHLFTIGESNTKNCYL